MAIISRGIGWSQESNLLWYILKQLNQLTGVLFGLKEAATPKYKVYTALLTQSGSGSDIYITTGPLTIGITYWIDDITGGVDFTNVGAPNNNLGTYFVATGTTPNSWGTGGQLGYNTGAPVVTVLENTIGNIWFYYYSNGRYLLQSNDELFPIEKTFISIQSQGADNDTTNISSAYPANTSQINLLINDSTGAGINDSLYISLEIRVYN